eukprot:CAMPEP_0202971446 /NCGR_PEP_ID=MMETSP1396-20130829/27231_1 /ASSEMBLY_ACC=CAM_ASM_000872 /TAXON_ID= /ORGANISM="Pseudokeronopsis sp., Strain Brazil" /LENGTH=35 /DNA_ID= /DNA_START= /DNA_END= /DNA_ORIENTATION=
MNSKLGELAFDEKAKVLKAVRQLIVLIYFNIMESI